jgi:hypothetical protein
MDRILTQVNLESRHFKFQSNMQKKLSKRAFHIEEICGIPTSKEESFEFIVLQLGARTWFFGNYEQQSQNQMSWGKNLFLGNCEK